MLNRRFIAFLFTCLCLSASSKGLSVEASAYCPPFYCEDIPLALELKDQKKRAAELLGLPKRLSKLFDALGNCQGCIQTAPSWPHLVVVYDGEGLSEHYGRELASYTTSRPWSASGEYKARQDQVAGLVREFHITLGSKPCKCCTAKSNKEYREWQLSESDGVLGNDPLWNSKLRTYASQTISFTSVPTTATIPDDLESIAPIYQRSAPVPGKLADFMLSSGVRVIQVLCEKCQGLADSYNKVGQQINAQTTGLSAVKRDLAYQNDMIDYSLSRIDAYAQLANSSNVRKKISSYEKSLRKAQSELAKLEKREAEIEKKIESLSAEHKKIVADTASCEQTQCIVEPDAPAIAIDPLEVYTLGDFDFLVDVKEATCPLITTEVAINSNNGNPLEITHISDKGRASDEMVQEVVGNNTNAPRLRSSVPCTEGETDKFSGTVGATVTDTVTGESTDIKISAKGKIDKNSKTSSDPNHQGYRESDGEPVPVDWESVESQCPSCQQLVAQYNDVMKRLFSARQARANVDSILKAPEKSLFSWSKNNPRELDPTTQEGAMALSQFMNLIEALRGVRRFLDQQILELEKQANYLQWAISECELEYCGSKDRLKFKEMLIGGSEPVNHYQPELSQLFLNYDVDWNGPYTTDCLACADITTKLNAMPGWITRAHFRLLTAQQYVEYYHLIRKLIGVFARPEALVEAEKELAEAESAIEQLALYNNKLLGELILCEAKYCPAQLGDRKVGLFPGDHSGNNLTVDSAITCPAPDAMSPINVGANDEVGSDADFKEKAQKQLAGAVAGAVTSLIGIGGGGGGGDSGPPTFKDPIKRGDKVRVDNKEPKRRMNVGAGFTPDGLLVSTEIDKAPGNGTFQAIFLQNPRGWRLVPVSLYLYEIWRSWKLSVSWTKDTYVDGEHVAHEEGGWTESWKELLEQGEYTNYVEVQAAPLWEQLGFNTAVSGAKSLGTLFPVSPAMLKNEPFDLYVHVTDPKQDPVITFPYHFRLSLGDKGEVVTEFVEPITEPKADPCKSSPFMSVAPGGGTVSAPGVSQIESGYVFEPDQVPNAGSTIEFVDETGKVVASAKTAPQGSSREREGASKDAVTPELAETPEPAKDGAEKMDLSDISEYDDEEIQEIMKDPSKFGRKLTPEEIAALKTRPTERDRDGDGIENNLDTMPDIPSDAFITGTMVGRILDHGNQSVLVDGDGAISVEVSNDEDGGAVIFEILGVELELSPGTILEASFG